MAYFVITLYMVAYLCTLINAYVDTPTGRIYEGERVTDCEEFPWHAQLIFYDSIVGGRRLCGGILIADEYVLTASHCSDRCNKDIKYNVTLGRTELRGNGGTVYVGKLKNCIVNMVSFDYDVAIIKITKPVIMTNCIKTLPILAENEMITDGLRVTAIGFGSKTIDGRFQNNLHKTTTLEIMNMDQCDKEAQFSHGLMTPKICTKSSENTGQNNCRGDSGGSLSYKIDDQKDVLVGIVSEGSDNCKDGLTMYPPVNDPIILPWIILMTENKVKFEKIV